MNLADLCKPFAPEKISWRVGSTTQDKKKGMALAYIDARDVMERLDEVCGLGWQCTYVPMPNGTCCCSIGVRVQNEWVWRSNGGVNVTDSENPDMKEMAEKGSYSDSFKRAAVLFGIGRYLYDLDSPWVELEAAGRSFKIAAHEYPKLRALLSKDAAAPVSAKPVPQQQDQIRKTPRQALEEIGIIKTTAELEKWENTNLDWLSRLQPVMPGPHKQLVDAIKAKGEALAA